MKHLVRPIWLLLLLVPALRAVADAPPGRYTITSGTVFDNRTKLTWQQTADSATYTQTQAVSHCSSLGGGWRLAKVSELLSITDLTIASGPAIDLTAFPNTGSEIFWSATSSSTFAWAVDFTDGTSQTLTLTTPTRARCVR